MYHILLHRILPYRRHAGMFLLALLLVRSAGAQFYEAGTEPASVKWQQIHTDHFRVIFPVDAVRDGQRAANVLEYIYRAENKTLTSFPEKIPIVLHNRTTFSNGFVSWAPRRSEWYLTPPQDNYAQHWLDQLAIHEYRHVVQISRLHRGFTRSLSYLIGQQSVGIVSGLLPKWFLEGDAVVTETVLTGSGRGRHPAFEMPLRTIALSSKYQKFDKAVFGSYRNHVPNYYELGYQLVSWIREHYGADVFEHALDFTARKPYRIILGSPFSYSLKKNTGYNAKELYRHAFTDLTERWKKQEAQTAGYDSIPPLTKRTANVYTDYRSPQYMDDSTLVVQKSSLSQTTQWVKIDKHGREQLLHTPGFVNSQKISCSGGLLVWTEQIQDIRWTNRSYSVIKLLDLQTHRERILRNRTRYYAPVLSPDGTTIAAVHVPESGTCAIVLLDVATGEEKSRLPNPQQTFLQTPSWSVDGKSLLAIANSGSSKSITRIDIATGLHTAITPPDMHDISCPVDGGNCVLFNAYRNGISNIYAADYTTGKQMQVTSARFGAFDPQPRGNRLAYSEYSAEGYSIVETDLDNTKWIPVDRLSDNSLKLHETIALQENFNMQDSIIPNTHHSVTPYRKWANLFNLHSWAPLYYEVDVSSVNTTEFYPGAVLLSQDLLGNLISSAGYSWRGFNAFHASLTCKALYPVIDFKIDHGGPAAVLSSLADDYPSITPPQSTRLYIRSYVPFTFTRSRWITGITPQVKLSYSNSILYTHTTGKYRQGLCEATWALQAYRYLKTSARDLAPRLGIILQGAFLHTPFNREHRGHIYFFHARFYLPGVAPHNSLRLSGAWQQQKTGNTLMFGSMLAFPRGYTTVRTEKLAMLTADYSAPLYYPDLNIGALIYLKRIQTNLFLDAAQNTSAYASSSGTTAWHTVPMLSTGIDLLADVILWRTDFPLSIGLRTAYVPDTRKIHPSLLFSVSFQ